jgi:flagellar FliL protein
MSEKADAQDAPLAKRRKTPILILLAALLLLGGGGAAAWILMKPDATHASDAADGPPARAKKHASPFVPLDPFTVNLADKGGERMAQIGVTLEVVDSETEAAVKARMPALRNAILLQLSASESSDLLTLAGKQRLAGRIAELAGGHVGWKSDPAAARARANPVEAVHFSQFIVQ